MIIKMMKQSDKGHQDPMDPFGKVWLVDVSCLAYDDQLSSACDLILSFSDHLLPYVHFSNSLFFHYFYHYSSFFFLSLFLLFFY